jgi:hypothetical protein
MRELDVGKWELCQRLKALDAELKAWLMDTTAAKELRRHHSQVRAFADMLIKIRRSIEPTAKQPIGSLAEIRDRSRVVLGLFRIWEFLRGKLAQRRESRFGPFLWLADEYAWLCYQPIYEQGFKEPPLIYLNGGYSPFTLTRHEPFQAESVPQELIRSRPLLEVIESLPFPVVGVPWYQVRNLADLPVIGHEIGHSVEADLQLTAAIVHAIDGKVADLSRRARWNAWGSEVFADLYGIIACGPAFVSALANFLSTEDQAAEPDEYPPLSIRFRFNIDALRVLGYGGDCEKLRARWEAVFPIGADLCGYVDDCPKVAAGLLDGISAGGKAFRTWIPFAADCKTARTLANTARGKGVVKHTEPFRALVAAYRFAYDDMVEGYDAAKLSEHLPRLDLLEAAMRDSLKPDLRAGERGRSAPELRAQSEANARRADVWLDALRNR